MKNLLNKSLLIVAIFLLNVNMSNAAIPIKLGTAKTEITATAATNTAVQEIKNLNKVQKKAILKQTTKAKSHSSAIPAIAYIILAIIGFGWLGMGINDNFRGVDWLISLLLYILFYIPGLIFTLIKMSKYY